MVSLITESVWNDLTAAARKNALKSYVAVAYFGAAGADLLPLRKGSWLAINASESAVKSGQTCPAALIKLQKLGVRIFNVQNLHAKLYVLGDTAFVGSANVSDTSATRLVESIVALKPRNVVKKITRFIKQKCCLSEIAPEQLAKLAKLYRPPKNLRARAKASVDKPVLPILRLAQLKPTDYHDDAVYARGLAKAEKKFAEHPDFQISDFEWWGRYAFKLDDEVIQVLEQPNNKYLVSPPAKVIHIERSRQKKGGLSYIYLQSRRGRRRNLSKLAKRLGRGSKKRLLRGGRLDTNFANRVRLALQVE